MPRYLGFRFNQTPGSPAVVTFVAPAEEIRTWAGVPHKTTDFIGGFQRPLSDRFKKIIDFFDEQGNASPTAIVVAFRPGMCKLSTAPLKESSTSTSLSYSPDLVTLDISNPAENESLESLAKRAYAFISERIAKDIPPSEEEPSPEEEPSSPSELDTEEALPEETSTIEDWGVDVGKSALKDFAKRLKDKQSLDKFINDIANSIDDPAADTNELKQAKARERLTDVLLSLLKPAMIVDGQHRVWGAAESTQEVPFTVCALIDADWQEQVFQFVVINKQARAISSELLASIVNSSLTNAEIVELEGKLDAAGISTYETKILRTLNDDPDSPFQGLISRGLEEENKKITFKAAIALASRWKRKMTDRDTIYRTLFRDGLPGTSKSEKSEAWDEQWKSYMFAFWNGVRNLYNKEQLWEPGTQLMYRATLEVLQENFLAAKALAGIAYKNPIELREDVEDFYKNVPAGFFHTKWKRTELLTEDGREVLRNALNAMRVSGAKLKSLEKSDPLFTGVSTKAAKKK
ncbi:hypothetical protein [Myxococcus sp. RHSTA-1-4]|uniref:hypothetical protein n=1 Tax=Myxococcus sp. RHSTA-1-4 TaxID=2874601 RepID=UPI001CBE07B9|nr:hypothetical protein [Myxococcus sp. RHSTA-1-4]MBZ4418762.1 hypothetical protein [Myxococcus sp. RHSTA-1-4]